MKLYSLKITSTLGSSFENPIPKYNSRRRPPSSVNLTAFNLMCYKMEDEFELCTVKEFHEAMKKN